MRHCPRRYRPSILIVASLAVLVGCTFVGCTRWNFLKPPESRPAPSETPTVAALVNYLNNNSQRIQTVRCLNIDMDCSQGLQGVGMKAKLMAQKPRNFMMTAYIVGNPNVDIGSNDQEFWFWISKAEPYQFYCSYRDLNQGRVQRLPFPFQPDWIIEAMGLGSYGPADRHRLEADGETLKLVEEARSPQGKPVQKVIVMNRRPVKAPAPQILAYLLQDEAGKEICSAHISEIQIDQGTQGILPRRIEFRWPEQRFKMKLTLDGSTVNPQPPIPASTFARRPLQGIPSFDLATGRVEQPSSLQRVEGRK